MGAYLLDHRNPHGDHFYDQRRGDIKAIVVHVTAGLETPADVDDDSAEATARYAASTERKVSWHSGSDTDSVIVLLPPEAVAFHVSGYNTHTYGHEISKRHVDWSSMPAWWVEQTLAQAASHLGPLAAQLGIPLRQATRAELDRAISTDGPPVGFIGHEPLDPDRRRDPGDDFPWTRLFALMSEEDNDMNEQQNGTLIATHSLAEDAAERSQVAVDNTAALLRQLGELQTALVGPEGVATPGEMLKGLRALNAQIAGLSAALEAIAVAKDFDPTAVTAAVERGVRNTLGSLDN